MKRPDVRPVAVVTKGTDRTASKSRANACKLYPRTTLYVSLLGGNASPCLETQIQCLNSASEKTDTHSG